MCSLQEGHTVEMAVVLQSGNTVGLRADGRPLPAPRPTPRKLESTKSLSGVARAGLNGKVALSKQASFACGGPSSYFATTAIKDASENRNGMERNEKYYSFSLRSVSATCTTTVSW